MKVTLNIAIPQIKAYEIYKCLKTMISVLLSSSDPYLELYTVLNLLHQVEFNLILISNKNINP